MRSAFELWWFGSASLGTYPSEMEMQKRVL